MPGKHERKGETPLNRAQSRLAAEELFREFDYTEGVYQWTVAKKRELVKAVNQRFIKDSHPPIYTKQKIEDWINNTLYHWRKRTKRPIKKLNKRPIKQPNKRTTQPNKRTMQPNKRTMQPNKQTIKRPIKRHVKQTITQPIERPMEQPIERPVERPAQPIERPAQPIDRPTLEKLFRDIIFPIIPVVEPFMEPPNMKLLDEVYSSELDLIPIGELNEVLKSFDELPNDLF
tara:strand:+ start:374 stop:1063 length:690 start_codon:yes stop_codon:yes gene_type:complete